MDTIKNAAGKAAEAAANIAGDAVSAVDEGRTTSQREGAAGPWPRWLRCRVAAPFACNGVPLMEGLQRALAASSSSPR